MMEEDPEDPEKPGKPNIPKRFTPWPDEFGPYHFGSYRNRGISFVLTEHQVPPLILFFI